MIVEVVADAVVQRSVLGAQPTRALVHEEQLVAVGVAQELRAAALVAVPRDRELVVAEQEGGPQLVATVEGLSEQRVEQVTGALEDLRRDLDALEQA